jgi:hypothetical protein
VAEQGSRHDRKQHGPDRPGREGAKASTVEDRWR